MCHVKMIPNSFDVDFIHGDIHGGSCKKNHMIWDITGVVNNVEYHAPSPFNGVNSVHMPYKVPHMTRDKE